MVATVFFGELGHQPHVLSVGRDAGYVSALRAEGFIVDEAPTGTAALAMVRDDHDVAIIDPQLPDLDGWEVCRRIKTDRVTNTVMVLTLSAADVNMSEPDRVHRGLGADTNLLHPVETVELVTTVRALTRLRAAEREREQQREDLLATVGHELRILLQGVTTLTHSLGLPPTLVDTDKSVIDRIMERTTRMVGQLVIVSHGLARQPLVTHQPVDLGELCRAVVRELQLQDTRMIQIVDKLRVPIAADSVRLRHLLDNLVGNALEHGTGPVTIELSQIRQLARITVHNAGPVIPELVRPTLFEPFRRGTHAGCGLGLGLFIVNQIALAHGGSVSMSSTSLDGTTMTVELPLTRCDPTQP